MNSKRMKHMIKTIKIKSGFTLTEIILSICMISLTGIIVVNLFLLSDTLNKKAKDIDKCVIISSDIIEAVKVGDSPKDLIKHEKLINAVFDICKTSVGARLFFDKNWEPVKSGGVSMYIIDLSVNHEKGNYSGVWSINVKCTREKKYYSGNDGEEVIYEIGTSVFFGGAR